MVEETGRYSAGWKISASQTFPKKGYNPLFILIGSDGESLSGTVETASK
jgi:hypothetical protein